MITVCPVLQDQFEEVLPLLRWFEKGNPDLNTDRWKMIFHYPWNTSTPFRGRALMDSEKIVGFEAFISKNRQIDGKKHLVGSHSSWVVMPEYRKYSLMLRSGWDTFCDEDAALTSVIHTARHDLHPIFKAYGYKVLEDHQWVFFPIPISKGWRVLTNVNDIAPMLNDDERMILTDHIDLQCNHFLAVKNSSYCYVVAVPRIGPRNCRSAQILYVSNPDLFLHCRFDIHLRACLKMHVIWMTIDGRWINPSVPAFARRVPFRSPKLFRSSELRAAQVDNLYSEIVLLSI
jgi:hypothetical protein